MSRVVVTGHAGFIGFHTAVRLLGDGHEVIGVDSFNDYYDVSLKEERAAILKEQPRFAQHRFDLSQREACARFFAAQRPDYICHLAAQAGVRYSIENPAAYIDSNLVAFGNILEAARSLKVKHLLYASSSSVYGSNTKMPFSVSDPVDHPVSLYAATKKANELMAHSYSHLYRIPSTGLRFFTVYGPYGRPDMAVFIFAKAILEDREISIFNEGQMRRDFTFVSDIVEGVVRILFKPPEPAGTGAPYKVFNIGNHDPVELMAMISTLELALGKTARKKFLPMQPGDVPATYADVSDLEEAIGFKPRTSLKVGIEKFVEWFRLYHAARFTSKSVS